MVIGAILHDLLEDTGVTYNISKQKFGQKIAKLVIAVSYNDKIKDKKTQYQDLFQRTKKYGRDALILKCADTYDNSFFIHLVNSKDLEVFLLSKIKYLLDISQSSIGKEQPWQNLLSQYKKEKRRIEEKYKMNHFKN